MACDAYVQFKGNLITVNRLLDTYDTMKMVRNPDGSRGRMALDHITRSAIVFLVASFEVYIEEIINECVNTHVKYARNFGLLPPSIQNWLHSSPRKYASEKWIQKYRRLAKEETDALNTPKIYRIDDLLSKYVDLPTGITNTFTHYSSIDPIIVLRGKIVHNVKGLNYIKRADVAEYIGMVCSFAEELNDCLALFFKNTYPNERIPWNKIR